MIKELFIPSKSKAIMTIPFIILFWFFPIVSKSIFAIPFANISSSALSLIMNLAFAYLFSCLIMACSNDAKKLVLVVVIVLAVYLLMPKIASYGAGDIGGATQTNCGCYGIEWESASCCHSVVNYCVGACKRNETVKSWLY